MIGAPQYLLTLYIAEREDDEESPISPGYVADALDRSPPAATERLQNLDAKGLVDYEPYEGATLTAEGRDAAADLYDTYQILSRFCRDVLGVNDHEGEAMQLVGNVSPTVAERLSATLLRGDGDRDGARQAAGSESTSSPDNPAS
ncbi:MULTISPECIES: metal-dependent transcriptional regulator [Haloferax]|jgi:DtxR family Mn-dependent transcriptional regulator|uniref:Iron-dependent repressor n=4 Tax=Haloferax TaxID=2251 RepID=A0A384KK09_HALVD|nr:MULTISPECIES: metal-dependent transcriptional regulator [Haloferax]ADE03142.1 SirR/DtxR family transcription regulator Idr2 [Haloferax volcanii DS2]ELY26038.1 iron-dependent repressor [Haloferax volcanii DS2]MBC9985340.1 metal-dependent transcriptional regulator [Haloferax sp. AS1]MBS8121024.1 metal-dependent transcriptional regulator [Haloferax volcanii]MBS8126061.1 metal-dependent transcriptional regulator [Haloferax volcanii]